MTAHSYVICEKDSVADQDDALVIIRCPSTELPDCAMTSSTEAAASECLSLIVESFPEGERQITAPPLLRPFLDLICLAPMAHIREAARLWGLSPRPDYHSAWREFRSSVNMQNGEEVPAWAQKLVSCGLAAWDGASVFLPRSVLAALNAPRPEWDAQVLHNTLQWTRRALSTSSVSSQDVTDYKGFLSSLLDPRVRGQDLLVYRCVDLPTIASTNTLSTGTWLPAAARAFCVTFKQLKPQVYQEVCRSQLPIWEAFGASLECLVDLVKRVNLLNAPAREGDYDSSCMGARSLLECLASAYYQLSRFERRMGVDRYMAPALIGQDIQQLHDLVRNVRAIVNNKLDSHRPLFQRDWGNFRVADIVRRLLGYASADPFTSRFPTNQKTVLLLVLDGLGFVQHKWNQLMTKDRRLSTFGGSVLDFLVDQPEYTDSIVLGSPLISDTGAGLAQIFSGVPSRENRVYSSYLSDGRGGFFDAKKVRTSAEWADRVGGMFPMTFFDDLEGTKVKVFACGARNQPSTFAQRNWGTHPVEPVNPSERFPRALLRDLQGREDARRLYVVYYPLIDHQGHSLGSFSSFELHEYDRLNYLLSSFILQLLSSIPNLFDGSTTVLITADHGMFESAGVAITLDEILQWVSAAGLHRPRVTMANRAILLYNVRLGELYKTEKSLRELLKSKRMDGEFVSRNDSLYHDLIYEGEDFPPRLPDLIILLRDEGLAIPRPIAMPYLHHGGHGGCSAEETYVPCISITLTLRLAQSLWERYGSLT